MFTCDACLRRALHSLASTASRSATLPRSSSLRRLGTSHASLTFSRNAATFESLRKGHHRHGAFGSLNNLKYQPKAISERKPDSVRAKALAKDRQAVEKNRIMRLGHDDRKMARAMQEELKYMMDPLKLAQGVLEKLRDQKYETALELVRASDRVNDGKGIANIVSWNHIIDWLMSQESPGEAWKVYNEMKKRGHKPDSYTYTIMLRGYRNNIKRTNVVQQAVSVYDSMFAANSAVTPNTIHTNTILSVCAWGHDIDAMWKIIGKVPERGPGAPDHITFTTLFQGLASEARERAIKEGAKEGPGFNPQRIFDPLIEDARKLWLDVTSRWRRGFLHIDEDLVCSMGRLLMLSDDPKTHMDVFNLIHQTMKVPRFAQGDTDLTKYETPLLTDSADGEEPRPSTVDYVPARMAANDSASNQALMASASVYATPGTNTLSMVVETATALKQLKMAKWYWDLLTSQTGPYAIVPDHENIMTYLRLLRISRASKTILDVLRQDRSDEVNDKLMVRGTFVIAMSACLRDKRNPNVFEHASRIMDLMQQNTQDATTDDAKGQRLRFSPKVLRMYVEVAIATTKGLNGEPLERTPRGDLDFERDPTKNHTFRALRRLGPDVINVRQMIKSYIIEIEQQAALRERTIKIKKLLDKRRITPYSTNENIEDLVVLLSTMISAYDKLILVNEKLEDEGLGPLPQELLGECWLQKRKLSSFVTMYAKATAKPDNRFPARSRPIHEQDHRLPSPPQAAYNDMESEDATYDANDDPSADTDLKDETTLPPSNPRAAIMKSVEDVQAAVRKHREERGLSRRQQLELIKREKIRAQFPASTLRDATPQIGFQKKKYRVGDDIIRQNAKERLGKIFEEGKARSDDYKVEGEGKPMPVWKQRKFTGKLERVEGSNVKAFRTEARKGPGEEIEETGVGWRGGKRRGKEQKERKEVKQVYAGWGQGFQDLVKEAGRDGKGFVKL